MERKKIRDVNVGERKRETWNESVEREKKRECGERERKKRREGEGNI
jgi:hypothetical protein